MDPRNIVPPPPSEGDSGPRHVPKAGTHIARCFQVLYIGHQENRKYKSDEMEMVPTITIGWELPYDKYESEDKDQNFYGIVAKDYRMSMGIKSNLCKHLGMWRGEPYTEEELAGMQLEGKGLDIYGLLEKPCMVSIKVNKSKSSGKEYANVIGVMALPEGQTCPELSRQTIAFNVLEPDRDVLEKLPEFLKEKIKGSPDWEGVGDSAAPPAVKADAAGTHEGDGPPPIDDDDLPF